MNSKCTLCKSLPHHKENIIPIIISAYFCLCLHVYSKRGKKKPLGQTQRTKTRKLQYINVLPEGIHNRRAIKKKTNRLILKSQIAFNQIVYSANNLRREHFSEVSIITLAHRRTATFSYSHWHQQLQPLSRWITLIVF